MYMTSRRLVDMRWRQKGFGRWRDDCWIKSPFQLHIMHGQVVDL